MKKRYWIAIVIFVFGIATTIFTYLNNSPIQNSTIVAQIIDVKETSRQKTTDENSNRDTQITQQVTAKILTGSEKNKKITLENNYSQSLLTGYNFRTNEKLFLAKNGTHYVVKDIKRDWVLVLALTLVITTMVAMMGQVSWRLLASLVLNAIIFVIAVHFDILKNGAGTLVIYGIATVLFVVTTLLFNQGFTKKTYLTIGATLSGVILTFLICMLVLHLTHEKGVVYESMELAIQDPRMLFLAQSILGILGAVMDESTDIIASLHELIIENPHLQKKDIWKSGLSVGSEIMGPLINVVVLLFMASALPMMILLVRNNASLDYAFQFGLSLGVLQSLFSAIGIVLTVPIATGASLFFLKKEDEK